MPSSSIIGIACYCIKLSKIEIGHLYLFFSTIFRVSVSMHRQSLFSSSANDIVYRIEKYVGFLYTNVIPLLVFVRILPLKYTIIFALLFIFLSFFYSSVFSLSFYFILFDILRYYLPLTTILLFALVSALQTSLDMLEWEGNEFIYWRFERWQYASL